MDNFKIRNLVIPLHPKKKSGNEFNVLGFENDHYNIYDDLTPPECGNTDECKPSCGKGSKQLYPAQQHDAAELDRLKKAIANLQATAVAMQ